MAAYIRFRVKTNSSYIKMKLVSVPQILPEAI